MSLALALIVPLTNDSPYGDLSRWYTDHIHNSHAAWVFFHRPLAVYKEPFGIASRGVAYRQAAVLWAQMPMAYPPGMFLVFAPLALIGEFLPISSHTFGVLGVIYTLVLAHLALFAVCFALERLQPGGRAVVGVVAWMFLLRLGLQGFYDSVWIGCGAMMVRALADRRPTTALRWCAAAALLHFRAAALAPLAVVALVDALRGKRVADWPWATLVAVAASLAIAIASFVLMYPATAAYRAQAHNLIQPVGRRFAMVVAASGFAVLVSMRWSDPGVVGVILVGALLAVIDLEPFWWHGTLLLFAPLAVGAWRKASNAAAARALLIAWVASVQLLAFGGSPADVFVELAKHFRLG